MRSSLMEKQSMRWVFTINNPCEDDYKALETLDSKDTVEFMVAEEEEGEQGTLHIQGYIELTTRCRRSTLSRLMPRAWIDIAKGSRIKNWEYCTKDGRILYNKNEERLITGPEQPKRKSGDERAVEILKDARQMSAKEFEAIHPSFWLYHRGTISDVMMEAALDSSSTFEGNLKSKNYWVWGEAGIGKSRKARDGLKITEIYPKDFNKWWNGFDPTKHVRVILDDYPNAPQGNILTRFLKIWGDRYAFTAEIKGGHQIIVPKFSFIITSNYSIDECILNDEDRRAVKRRFQEIHMTPHNKTLDNFWDPD